MALNLYEPLLEILFCCLDEDGTSEFRIRKSAASRRLARLKNIAANNPENTVSSDRSERQIKRETDAAVTATKSNGRSGRPNAVCVSDSDSEGDHSEERLEVNSSFD